jgi:hypothetical protein
MVQSNMHTSQLTRSAMRTLAAVLATTAVATMPFAAPVQAEDRPQRIYVKDRDGKVARPEVAVDNVTAWPNLTVLQEGTIIASIFNQPNHGLSEGSVECWGSVDGGRTWKLRGTPAPHEPGTNRMNVAAGLAGNGDLLVIASGWSHRPSPPQKAVGHKPPAQILRPWLCRSADGGRTWSIDREAIPQFPDGQDGVPFGDILPGSDGALYAGFYRGGVGEAYVMRSADHGKTWGDLVQVDQAAVIHEPALASLGDGKWLLAARHAGLTLYTSDDDAKSWQKRQKLTGNAMHPGHFLQLKDGRLLLSYGNRVDPKGVDVRLSDDQGQSWSEPLRVADFQGDGGYPASVQLPDGQVMTAFYAQQTANHPRYHMGVVTWELPAQNP